MKRVFSLHISVSLCVSHSGHNLKAGIDEQNTTTVSYNKQDIKFLSTENEDTYPKNKQEK